MQDIQRFINESIERRSQIWGDYDRAIASERELTSRFSSQFNSPGTVPSIKPLTAGNLPSEEVLAVIANLEKTERQIAQAKSSIQNNENEIEMLKIKARNLIIALSATGIILFGGLIIYIKNKIQNNSGSSQPSSINSLVYSKTIPNS